MVNTWTEALFNNSTNINTVYAIMYSTEDDIIIIIIIIYRKYSPHFPVSYHNKLIFGLLVKQNKQFILDVGYSFRQM